MANWPNERVELLKRLWQDGIPASIIAKQLGDGLTSNAVIGKVHRLRLPGRHAAATPGRAPARSPRPAMVPPPSAPRAIAPSGFLQDDIDLEVLAPLLAPKPMPARVRYECIDAEPVTVMTLGAHMCKWPIGDPTKDNFSFCGKRATYGPYCKEHGQVCYQPAQERKNGGANDLMRSLRRYI